MAGWNLSRSTSKSGAVTSERAASLSKGVVRPSLLRMLLRYWWLVIVVVALFVGLAFVVDAAQPTEYEARADLIVEDPRASRLFEIDELSRPSTQSSERYLADQVEIVGSAEVANLASEMLDGRFSANRLLLDSSVAGDLNSNLIEVFFTASSREGARDGANAIANAYQEVRRRQVQATAAVALAKVDAIVAALDVDLMELDARIAEVRGGDEALQELNRQFAAAQEELNRLRTTRDSLTVDSPVRATINAQIEELLRDFSTWEVVLRISERGSELNNLLAEKDAMVAEKSTLVARANSIEVDAELAAGGVILFSPAQLPIDPTGIPLLLTLAIAVMLGLVVAALIAYYLSLRRDVVVGRRGPRAVLDAPLLAEVPHFDLESIESPKPVVDAPATSAAEAFRFAAAVLDIRAGAGRTRLITVVSASRGAGRTAVVANAGLAAAADGVRTLVVDADFGKQDLTHLLAGAIPSVGLTDAVDERVTVAEAVTRIPVRDERTLAVLSRGSKQVDAAAYLRSERTRDFFSTLHRGFDLVLIDGPPLLQAGYASTLALNTDAAIVVVEHGSDVRDLEEVRDHLALIDIPILGYMYTKAPALHPTLAPAGTQQTPDPEATEGAIAPETAAEPAGESETETVDAAEPDTDESIDESTDDDSDADNGAPAPVESAGVPGPQPAE